jgi:short-subunit dehydrogenase
MAMADLNPPSNLTDENTTLDETPTADLKANPKVDSEEESSRPVEFHRRDVKDDLSGKVVVITGASSGFGKGAAREFGGRGASVVLAARRDELLDELADQIQAAGGRALSVPTDVSHENEVEELCRTAVERFGRIDVWVNNAGVGALGRFEEVPLADHVKVIQTDLLGTLYGSYFVMKVFREQGNGILINIASVIGKVPAPYYSSYAAAKHGVVGLSAVLRQELEQNNMENIHVCTVMPTSFDTPFFDHSPNYTGHETVPIPPVYDPERVVDTIVRLATDPEAEVSVGTAAKIATMAHQIAPGMTESRMGKQAHKAHIVDAPPAPNTEGSVQKPQPEGRGVTRSKGKRSA